MNFEVKGPGQVQSDCWAVSHIRSQWFKIMAAYKYKRILEL